MNRLSRLTALLLALLMLLSNTAFAEAAAGISFDDFNEAAYSNLKATAMTVAEEETADDGKLSFPCDEMPEYCLFDTYSGMTATELQAYFNEMYAEDGDGEMSVRYSAVMIHYGEYHLDSNLICTCGEHPLPMPDIMVGDISQHEAECPWHFANLTVPEQYVIMCTLSEEEQENYTAVLTAEQAQELETYTIGQLSEPCGEDNAYCQMVDTLVNDYTTPQERYEYLCSLYSEETTDTTLEGVLLHYYYYMDAHTSENVICMCSGSDVPPIAPGADGHDEDCVWHANHLTETENPNVETELVKTTEDGTSVTVSGSMPEGAELIVKNADTAVVAQYLPALAETSSRYIALDVTLSCDGVECQPDGGVKVEVSAKDLAADGEQVTVYHIHDDAVEVIGTYTVFGSVFEFEMDSFSYVVAVNENDGGLLLSPSCDVYEFESEIEKIGAMTIRERSKYLNAMRVEGLAEGEEPPSAKYASVMIHYGEHHLDNDWLCTCGDPMLDPDTEMTLPGASEHESDCPWYSENLPNEQTTLTETIDGVSLSIDGLMPADVSVNAKTVSAEDVAAYMPTIDSLTSKYLALDITLDRLNGEQWQPDDHVSVKLSADALGAEGDTVLIYYVHENEDGTVEQGVIESCDITDGFISFEMDSFSCVFPINVDTVEDCWVEELAPLSVTDRYSHMMRKKSEDLTVYNLFLGHYMLKHVGTGVICECKKGTLSPTIYAPGALEHTDASCTWNFNFLTTAEQYEIIKDKTEEEKSQYIAKLDQTQIDELNAYIESMSGYNKPSATVTMDGASVQIDVPDGVFGEGVNYFMTAAQSVIDDAKKTALYALGSMQLLAAVDVSFENADVAGEMLDPINGTIPVTFTVNVSEIEGNSLKVVHLQKNADGTYTAEIKAENIAIDATGETMQVVAQADEFSDWILLSECDGEACGFNLYMALDDGLEEAAGNVAQYKYLMGEKFNYVGVELEEFLMHVAICHLKEDGMPEDMCGCGGEWMIYAPGSKAHDVDGCAWKDTTADIQLHYDAYASTDVTNKAFYLLGLDEDQLAALEAMLETEEEKEEMQFLVIDGVPAWLLTDAIRAWLADETIEHTTEMIKRGYEVDKALTASGASFAWNVASRLEDPVLVDVYTGVVLADYNAVSNELYDRLTGLYVGTLDTDGTIVGPTSFVIGVTPAIETETTTE